MPFLNTTHTQTHKNNLVFIIKLQAVTDCTMNFGYDFQSVKLPAETCE